MTEQIKTLAGWKRNIKVGMQLKCNAPWHEKDAIRIVKEVQSNAMALTHPTREGAISWLFYNIPASLYHFENGNKMSLNDSNGGILSYEIIS